MRVRFFDPGKQYITYKTEIDAAQQDAQAMGDLVLRQDVEKFENNLAEYIGTKYAVGVNSGTDALELALRSLKIGPGDEVITVSNTFKATITAIRKVGATPVLVDVGEDYLMDIEHVGRVITEKTKAVIPVHISGDICDMESLQLLLYSRGITVIEDAAQALGSYLRSRWTDFMELRAGRFGTVGCFSFYPAKILGAPGDAGAITTDDPKIYGWISNYRNHCKDIPGEDGTNSRLDNIWAATLNVKFRHLAWFLLRRRQIAYRYGEALADLPIVLPKDRVGRVWQDYVIRAKERSRLHIFLREAGIETMIPPLLPHIELGIPAFLPHSERFNEEFLRLPCNDVLDDVEVEYVCEKIKEFYSQ